MLKSINVIGLGIITVLLYGCHQASDQSHHSRQGGSTVAEHKTNAVPNAISSAAVKKSKRIRENQAMAWLQHNQYLWDDGGKLKKINWYDFWEVQINSQSFLAKKAYRLCHGRDAGANCQTYWQAYTMSKSAEIHHWGEKKGDDI